MAKNQVYIDVVIDDNGTTKRVAVNAKKLGIELDKSAKATEKGQKNTEKFSKSQKDLDRNMRGTAKMAGNSTKEFSKMQQGMGGIVGAYATLAAQVFAVSAAFQFLNSAANLNNLISGQEAMGSVTGRTYKTITQSIIAATDAQLKYADAAKAAAIGSAAGLTIGQLTKLGTVAKNASFALGRDLTDSFNRLIRGVTKAEPELLDELGIILRLEPATEKYARSIGVARTELNAFQRTQAVTNEVLEQGTLKFSAIEAMMSKDAAALAQFTKSFDELINTLKRGLIQGLNPALQFLSENTMALVGVLGLVAIPIVKSILPNMDAFLASTKKLQRAQSIAHEKRKRELKEEQAAIKKSMLTNRELHAQQQQQASDTASSRGNKQGAGMGFLTGAPDGGRGAQASKKMIDDAKQQMKDNGEVRTGQMRQYSKEDIEHAQRTYDQKIANAKMSEKELVGQKKLTNAESAKLNKKMSKDYKSMSTRVVGMGRFMAKALNKAFAAVAIFGMLMLAFELIKKIISVMNPLTQKQKEEEAQAKSLTAVYKQLNEELERNANVRRNMLGTSQGLQNKGQSMQGVDMPTLIENMNSMATRKDKGSDEFNKAQEELDKLINKSIEIDGRFSKLKDTFADGIIPEDVAKNMRLYASEIIETGHNLGNLGEVSKVTTKAIQTFGSTGATDSPLQKMIKAAKTELTAYDKAVTDTVTAGKTDTTLAAVTKDDQTMKDMEKRLADMRAQIVALKEGPKNWMGGIGMVAGSQIDSLESQIYRLDKAKDEFEDNLGADTGSILKLKKQGIAASDESLENNEKERDAISERLGLMETEDKRQKMSDSRRLRIQKAFNLTRTKAITLEGKLSNVDEDRFKIANTLQTFKDKYMASLLLEKLSTTENRDAAEAEVVVAKENFDIAVAEHAFQEGLIDSKETQLELDIDMLGVAKEKLDILDAQAKLQRDLAYAQGTSGGSRSSRSSIREMQGEQLQSTQLDAQAALTKKGGQEALTRKEMLADAKVANMGMPLGPGQVEDVETQLRMSDASAQNERNAVANATNSLNIHKHINKSIHDTNVAKLEGLAYDVRGAGLLGEAKILNELMRDARLANPDYVFNEKNLGLLKSQATEMERMAVLADQKQQLADSIQGGMETAFMSIIDGSKSAKEAFADMAKSILAAIAKMIVQALVLKMLQTALPGLFGAKGGTTPGAIDTGASMNGGMAGMAVAKKGGRFGPGYAAGGYSSKKNNFSRGGMARGAQAGYAATLHGNEAVVPLPDNRSIPVTLNGAGGQNNNVTVNVAMDSSGNGKTTSSQDNGADGAKMGALIAGAVQKELQYQKRSGGILNPYGVA